MPFKRIALAVVSIIGLSALLAAQGSLHQMLLTSGTSPLVASDNFTRADQNPLGSPGWTSDSTDPRTQLEIVNNQVVPTTATKDADTIYTGITWPNDQWCQAVLSATDTTDGNETGPGLVVRGTVGTMFLGDPDNGYVAAVNKAATNNLVVGKIVSGVFTLLTNSTVTWSNGNTFYLGIQGTTLTVKINGTAVYTTTDSSLSSGSAGLWWSSEPALTTTNWNSFQGGKF